MELISKISKGSKMDQIYIPKNRHGFSIGDYVLITPINLSEKKIKSKNPYFYGIKNLEPIKLTIINEVFDLIEKKIDSDNIIIAGSFVEPGFCFNDLDILIITENKIDEKTLSKDIENLTGIKPHLIVIDNKSLIVGLSTDPLYQSMLSKCVSRKRFLYKVEPKINYKILDLHLFKSNLVIDTFDGMTGSELYYYTQNMIAIYLFIKNRKVIKDEIEQEIKKQFGLNKGEIKQNLIEKKEFLKTYKEIYNKTFDLIMKGVKKQDDSK